MKLPVVLKTGEDGWIVAECPLIPGFSVEEFNKLVG
jgi:hypothetical protein